MIISDSSSIARAWPDCFSVQMLAINFKQVHACINDTASDNALCLKVHPVLKSGFAM